jgi:Protein of unknown function (DUF3108)
VHPRAAALRSLLAGFALAVAVVKPAGAEGFVALYSAYWAGLPAAAIRLEVHDDPAGYRDEIAIITGGLPRLVTHFRGHAITEGRLAAQRTPTPVRYEAFYDLRKRRDRHLDMRFVAHGGAIVAQRGPGDTSRKPPLAEKFRRNVVDPMTALTTIREELRQRRHIAFTVPVYDGARRFDVVARVMPKKGEADSLLRLVLTLRPIAGFKGESSDDGDPDTSPRRVVLTFTDDARLMPLSMTVPVFYLPLDVRFDRLCTAARPCPSR